MRTNRPESSAVEQVEQVEQAGTVPGITGRWNRGISIYPVPPPTPATPRPTRQALERAALAAHACGANAKTVCGGNLALGGQQEAETERTPSAGVLLTPPVAGSLLERAGPVCFRGHSKKYFIHFDDTPPPGGPRGAIELTTATPSDKLTCGESPRTFSPPAEIPAVDCVRSAHLPHLVTLPAVPFPPDAPPQALPSLDTRPRPWRSIPRPGKQTRTQRHGRTTQEK